MPALKYVRGDFYQFMADTLNSQRSRERGLFNRDYIDRLLSEPEQHFTRLNGSKLYLRGILDQGYFPGGWYTPLTDDDIRTDVELTLAMGLNCARKHQKAEDPRYLYWADKLGLLER